MVLYLLEIQKLPIFFQLVGNILGKPCREHRYYAASSVAQLGRDKQEKKS
jgi:hypothetical protein